MSFISLTCFLIDLKLRYLRDSSTKNSHLFTVYDFLYSVVHKISYSWFCGGFNECPYKKKKFTYISFKKSSVELLP